MSVEVSFEAFEVEETDEDDDSSPGSLIFRRSFFTLMHGRDVSPRSWAQVLPYIIAFNSPSTMDNLQGRGSNLQLLRCRWVSRLRVVTACER
ncbi:hypothetical protein OIU74_011546 [Salix koriyanagi]|uniref:Uncharacterized protein n=1 Tax=Salix koriyanagi TaxID=2511006 RepID=A0A9Q0TFG8_9ROSI|nr:hypothetical protein OIU74_011546 [Salix koriyanagi]